MMLYSLNLNCKIVPKIFDLVLQIIELDFQFQHGKRNMYYYQSHSYTCNTDICV